MRILGIMSRGDKPNAVDVYRITLPLEYLNNKTQDIRCGWMTLRHAETYVRNYELDAVFDYDIIIFGRPISDEPSAGQIMDALRVRGAKVIYETDDDYSGIHRQATVVPDKTWAPYIGNADAITVTTKPLADLVRRESGGRPVYVVPNAIDREWFTAVAKTAKRVFKDHLTVMLAGTQTHYRDWRVLETVIPKIQAAYPNVKFLVGGFMPDYLEELCEYQPPVPYHIGYPMLLAQADILCAPLVPDDKFNHSKSPIKAIEGWCAARPVSKTSFGGCAVVASKCIVYKGTVQHRHNGLLVDHTPDAWEDALRLLIEDRFLRQKLQIEGLKDASDYDIERRWQDWAQAYRSILTDAKEERL